MMLDIGAVIPAVLSRLKKMQPGQGMDLRTYKRDRSVKIVRLEGNLCEVMEDGFTQQRFETNMKGLKKLLKTLLRREFPRSNKVRVSEIGG